MNSPSEKNILNCFYIYAIFLFYFSESFLILSSQDLTNFFCAEEGNKDVNENSFGEEDALFVKSEDTLVFALRQWAEHQNSINSSDDNHLIIENLIKYINWSEVSQEVVKDFALHYPALTNSSKYLTISNF